MNFKEWKALSAEEKKKVKFKNRPGGKFAIWLLVGVAAIWIIIGIASPKAPPAKPEAIVHNSSLDFSVVQVEDYLRANLNDPDSYEPAEWSKVITDSTPPLHYVVRHKYRAKNAFGGVIVQNQLFYLDSMGNVTNVVNP